MSTLPIESAADIAVRLASEAVANTVAEGGDAGFDARFHRSLFLGACADAQARESKVKAIRAAGAAPSPIAQAAPPGPYTPSVDPIIAAAVAAGIAEANAGLSNEVADRRARAAIAEERATAATEADTARLVSEIAALAPGRVPAPGLALASTAEAGPTGEADAASRMAAEIAAFIPTADQAEIEPESAESLAAQIAAFVPNRGESAPAAIPQD